MFLSQKSVFLPVLAISLIVSSAFAGGRRRLVEPSLGNLAVISLCNAAAAVASLVAIDKYLSESSWNIPFKILATGFWLNLEHEAIKEYEENKMRWQYAQVLQRVSDYWNNLHLKYPKKK